MLRPSFLLSPSGLGVAAPTSPAGGKLSKTHPLPPPVRTTGSNLHPRGTGVGFANPAHTAGVAGSVLKNPVLPVAKFLRVLDSPPRVWYNTVKDKIYNEMFRERLFEKFDGFVKKMNMFLFSDGQLGLALGEIQSEFYDNNLITAEECAQQMQERAEIYLKE